MLQISPHPIDGTRCTECGKRKANLRLRIRFFGVDFELCEKCKGGLLATAEENEKLRAALKVKENRKLRAGLKHVLAELSAFANAL
jgi:hypothetical protein